LTSSDADADVDACFVVVDFTGFADALVAEGPCVVVEGA
jgi:hypothetical protein